MSGEGIGIARDADDDQGQRPHDSRAQAGCSDCAAKDREIERLQVQLAWCSTAAMGHGSGCKKGDYGWSVAYQYVMDVRAQLDAAEKREAELRATCRRAVHLIHHEDDYHGGMSVLCEVAWIPFTRDITDGRTYTIAEATQTGAEQGGKDGKE